MAGMIDLAFEQEAVNLALLHQELVAALGAKLVGLSGNGRGVRVHLLDSTTPDERKLAGQIVAGHDGGKLTADQQAGRERGAALDALRKPWAQQSSTPTTRRFAQTAPRPLAVDARVARRDLKLTGPGDVVAAELLAVNDHAVALVHGAPDIHIRAADRVVHLPNLAGR